MAKTTAKSTAKKTSTKTVKTKSATKAAAPAAEAPAAKALSPREQAKALLEQKTSAAKWQALYAKAKTTPAASYNMKNSYEKQTALNHKTLGWGYIVDNRNGRLEVLFQDGIKHLISNYK